MTEEGPVRIPKDVLEELISTLRYAASEGGKTSLVVWIDKHPGDYGRGLLDGFEAED